MISVKIVNTFRGIVSKIYIPKYMLILEKLYVNFFKMLISFGIVAGFAAAYRIKPTAHLLYCVGSAADPSLDSWLRSDRRPFRSVHQ